MSPIFQGKDVDSKDIESFTKGMFAKFEQQVGTHGLSSDEDNDAITYKLSGNTYDELITLVL